MDLSYPEEVEERLSSWRIAATGISAALDGGTPADWSRARATYNEALAAMFAVPEGVTFDEIDLAGSPTTVVNPSVAEHSYTLLYLHGGGYASGGAIAYRSLAGWLAGGLQARVLIPDYRLAPQHRFPAPIDDALAAYRVLLDQGVDPARLAIAGDSAGGAMMLTVLRRARDAGLPLPAAGVAFSPWADLAHAGASAREKAERDPLVRLPFLEALAAAFLGDTPVDHPDASPVHADFTGLPPILLQVGEREVMLSDAIRLVERLSADRVRVSLDIWPDMFHVFQLFAGLLPQADAALSRAAAFLGTAFAGRDPGGSAIVAEPAS